jgi:hypothetical protein
MAVMKFLIVVGGLATQIVRLSSGESIDDPTGQIASTPLSGSRMMPGRGESPIRSANQPRLDDEFDSERTRHKSRRRIRRYSRTNDDRRQTQNTAIDEASSRIFVDEQFRNELATSIRTFRGCDRIGSHALGLRPATSASRVTMRKTRTKQIHTRRPPYTAIELEKTNVMGRGAPQWRAASSMYRIESTFTYRKVCCQ